MIDQAWFCEQVALTNKVEFLKWAREVKQCEWDEWTINAAADKGNLEMLKYCFSNECPCDEEMSHIQAAINGHLDCLRLLFDKVEPSRKTEKDAAAQATCGGHVEILKYFVDERKISDNLKLNCVGYAALHGRLDCLKYLVEEAKVPLHHWEDIAYARYYEQRECENYLLEKECPEPTDEEYAEFVEDLRPKKVIKKVAKKRVPAPKKVPVKKAPAKKKYFSSALAAKKYASRKLQNALQKVDLEDREFIERDH